jgi:Squalene-hopene cyclase C-terminal domain
MTSLVMYGAVVSTLIVGGLYLNTASAELKSHVADSRFSPAVEKGLAWLVCAQHEDGGWGAGAHSHQEIIDPHAVPTDPATTAFAALAFLRVGSTPTHGEYASPLRRSTEYLLKVVEAAPPEGPRITDMTGTQPQVKLGNNIDVSLILLYFARLLPRLDERDPLRNRVDAALEKCLRKVQGSQSATGAWDEGGWAGVLQSSLGCSALEFARAAGKPVNERLLTAARDYHKRNLNVATGKATAADGAGVELYAWSGSARATAAEAHAAKDLLDTAVREGRVRADAQVSATYLQEAGVPSDKAQDLAGAYDRIQTQIKRMDDSSLLQGFGVNGGEEYVSYMLTSETLVLVGGESWTKWNDMMQERLAGIQRENGSWGGQHCITGGAFCTSAVIQCLTAERDADLLRAISAGDMTFQKR